METRNVKVTLDKAKEWYFSDNSILKEIALQAFTKKELETLTYDEISFMVGDIDMPKEEIILRVLSEYYRKDSDRFYSDTEKYFIAQDTFGNWTIIKHSSVKYPGLAYYLRKQDAQEALEIFLKEIKNK